MQIIAVYIVLVLIGEFGSYLIGRAVEMYSVNASMPVFLACFFAVFGIAWSLAVRLTEPKGKHAEPKRKHA
jgi:hypothetical protein